MRKLMVLVLFLLIIFGSFSAPVYAQKKLTPAQKNTIERIKKRVEKLSPQERKAAITSLSAKLTRLRLRHNQIKLARQRTVIAAEIWRIEKELELLEELGKPPRPALPPGQVMPPGQAKRLPPPTPRPRPQPRIARPRSPQIGLSAGYIGGVPGVLGELRFFEPFALTATSLRLGAAYAQGEDTDGTLRKHALIVLDGIYRLNPPRTPGIRSYIGLGANYNAYTTGEKSGDVGGHAFYGIEGGSYWGGQMFFEIGYGTVRTGFSPDYTGLTALLGFKF